MMCVSLRHLLLVTLFVLPYSLPGQNQAEEEQPGYNSNALSYYMDGELAMMQGDYAQATEHYRNALQYDSTSYTLHLAYADALMYLGQVEKAWMAGGKALELAPDEPQVYEFLARNAQARKKPEDMFEYLDHWSRIEPDNLEPLFRKAAFLDRQGKVMEAVDAYLQIYDQDPIQQQVLPRAGDLAVSIGDMERAFQVYSRLYKVRPND